MALATIVGAVLPFVILILAVKNPAQILGAVVQFVAVEVRDLMLMGRRRTVESFADQAMDKDFTRLAM